MNTTAFSWPEGRRAAFSMTFDDGRRTQLDNGISILNRYGVKATFYPMPEALESDPERWRDVAAKGHEIGNHSLRHPCSCNFAWSRANPLEDYSLERMERELKEANARIEAVVGTKPVTFAYPCGEQYVGRGEGTLSYVPVVARNFLVGRGFDQWGLNDPVFCDLAKLHGRDMDRAQLETLQGLLDEACRLGSWLVLAAHEVAEQGDQAIAPAVLEAFCEHVTKANREVWTDTTATIGRYLRRCRGNNR
ncbi:MAG: hypothetical protein PCFJNLEI_00662 [Verrucomicrobiae bacterium]|nr:hypothetical protein [Verrucomicrobiae bacterium]